MLGQIRAELKIDDDPHLHPALPRHAAQAMDSVVEADEIANPEFF